MIAYNWFDCDIQPQPAFINWAAGCVVPPRVTRRPCDDMLLPFFEWCEATLIGNAIRDSLWLFPVIEAVHLLGLCLLGGAAGASICGCSAWACAPADRARSRGCRGRGCSAASS